MAKSTAEQTFAKMYDAWQRERESFDYFIVPGEQLSADLQHRGFDESEVRVPLSHLEELQDAGLIRMQERKRNSGQVRITPQGAERERALEVLRNFRSS
jgi:uncharacterized protein Smg (DUF494 family)